MRTALISGCAARLATRKHLAARSRYVGLLTLLIPLSQNAMVGVSFPSDLWERLPVLEVTFLDGGGVRRRPP
jgi:hypothetical protein